MVRLKKTVYLKQSRDALGRFGSIKKEEPKPGSKHFIVEDGNYTKKQVKELVGKAFLEGLNRKSSFILPSKQLERYLKEIEL
jgi:hypothetical protein